MNVPQYRPKYGLLDKVVMYVLPLPGEETVGLEAHKVVSEGNS